MSDHKILKVKQEHIQPGIEKYKGKLDAELQRHLKNAELDYLPYVFEDGRVMMVLEMMEIAFLYPNKQAVFETLFNS